MELQKLYSKVRQAVDAYEMIEDGDRIAVGISGGKDSLTLLYALAGMRKFYPKQYDVVAITVDTGVGEYMERTGQNYAEADSPYAATPAAAPTAESEDASPPREDEEGCFQ